MIPDTELIVVGDIHGDYDSLTKILEKSDFENSNRIIVFLGDYADRGANGLEVYNKILSLKKRHPKRVVMLKGNHESYTKYNGEITPLFAPCTFVNELMSKVDNWREKLEEFFDLWKSLPIAAIVEGKYLFVHGGISSKIKSLEDLKNPTLAVEEDVLWSDPYEEKGECPNPRGAGILFGPDVSKKVCEKLGIKKIIRSHQPHIALSGCREHHDGRIITISSTTVYGGTPAFLKIKNNKITVDVV